jgi:hypothetical protein
MKKEKVLTFMESPDGVQLKAGKLKGNGRDVWHSDDHNTYWCGNWGKKSYRELYAECKTIIDDLIENHPDLKE